MNGGYDDGYNKCDCFWGSTPGSLVQELETLISWKGLRVLDAGCGEGKNARYVADQGADVLAVDISEQAISHAIAAHGHHPRVEWVRGSVVDLRLGTSEFDVILMYGLLHCLPDESTIEDLVERLQRATAPCGYNVVCAFNERRQELERAHPGFAPTLLEHQRYLSMYDGWELIHASDSDLHEVHPHNNVAHTHSMTRVVARRAAG